MTEIQKQVVSIVASTWAKLHDVAYASGCSERILNYWIDGKRIPRDIEVIDNVLDTLGYKLTIVKADRKTEPQIRCPNCGRTDYIRSFEKDFGIKDSGYKYKCINCNTYIKDEPQTNADQHTQRIESVEDNGDIIVRSNLEPFRVTEREGE